MTWSHPLARCRIVTVMLAAAGCADPPTNDTLAPPSRGRFAPVARVLGVHCGTLDCHGAVERNLRVHGIYGTRLATEDVAGFGSTTEAEVDATYESVIALDPERLSRVVQNGGVDADSWIVVAKGRDVQQHVGGARLVPGEPPDDCLVRWLSSRFDEQFDAACESGAIVVPPDPEW